MSRGSPGAMRPPVISPGPLASADLSQSSQSESTVGWNVCTHIYTCSMHHNSVRGDIRRLLLFMYEPYCFCIAFSSHVYMCVSIRASHYMVLKDIS